LAKAAPSWHAVLSADWSGPAHKLSVKHTHSNTNMIGNIDHEPQPFSWLNFKFMVVAAHWQHTFHLITGKNRQALASTKDPSNSPLIAVL
jgi:hypothetical protein